jgi:4'-phosphopantetheinyl transferase
MPILIHRNLEPAGELGLWSIEEEEEWFLDHLVLSEEEEAQLKRIKGHRRIEWLSARMLIHHMSGREDRGFFYKDQFGKPHLEASPFYISISHSRKIAAAIAAPSSVGIDIQRFVPKINRITHKFLNEEEIQNLDVQHRLWHLHVCWGAKEALYKAYGRRQLNFCEHIRIDAFSFQAEGGTFQGQVQKNGQKQVFQLTYELIENYALVYAVKT